MAKIAIFRFEAAPAIGAGHAIRTGALADLYQEHGWQCKIVTDAQSLEFMPALARFERIDPATFTQHPFAHDLLVIDNYGLDATYGEQFRDYAKTILVIDDLANRPYCCDFILDQTYGRNPSDYQPWVSPHCQILTGADYTLLRPEFAAIRPHALNKRRHTQHIERIMISLGGIDPHNYTLTVLKQLKEIGTQAAIDIVLGFVQPHRPSIDAFITTMPNQITIHDNANMAELTLNTDLAIGAAGSSIWERNCLGVPCVIVQTADNQALIYQTFTQEKLAHALTDLPKLFEQAYRFDPSQSFIDGFGRNRIYQKLLGYHAVQFRKVNAQDVDLIFQWQHEANLRRYFIHPNPPTRQEHEAWFAKRLNQVENPFWMIEYEHIPCGTLALNYDFNQQCYELSWYLTSSFHGKGIGTECVKQAVNLVWPIPIKAYVKSDNTASQRSLEKAGLKRIDENNFISA